MYEVGAAIILMLIIIIIFMYVIKSKDTKRSNVATTPQDQGHKDRMDQKDQDRQEKRRVTFGQPEERQYELTNSEIQSKQRTDRNENSNNKKVHTIAELRDNRPDQLLKLASYLGSRYYCSKYNSSIEIIDVQPQNNSGTRFVMEFNYRSLVDNDQGSDVRIFSIKDTPDGIAFDKMGGYNGANIV